jgi:hypothetical protein
MAIGGTCALCLKVKGLVSSHYIPAFCYRDLREKIGLRHPVLVTEEVSVLRSKQLQHPLLCKDCEEKFNRGGERWVANQSARSTGSFPLRSLLRRQSPHSSWEGDSVYFAEFIVATGVEHYIHFAAGVFWRGAIFDWGKLGANSKQLTFDPQTVEGLRKFLMSTGPFPSALNLLLEVDPDPKPMPLLFPPAPVAFGDIPEAGYFFSACGLVFTVLKHPWPDRFNALSLAEKPHPMRITSKSTLALKEEAKRIRKTSIAKGKLGRSGPSHWRS